MDRLSRSLETHKATAFGGADVANVQNAERALGFDFPADYRVFLFRYGALKHDGDEIYGLGPSGYNNMINATRRQKELDPSFPDGFAVLYNLGIEGILILLCADGGVYEYSPGGIRRIFDTFTQWVEEEFFEM